MTTVLQKYHTFLEEKDITEYSELIIELIDEPYYLHISSDQKYSDLVLFNITDETDLELDITNIFDGLIVSKINIKEIICYSGNFYEDIEESNVNSLFSFNLKGITFTEIEDGTYIRLFNYNDEWIVSTLTNINANQEIIEESESITVKNIFDMFCSQYFDYNRFLNKQYIYFFALNTSLYKRNLIHMDTFNAFSSFKKVTHRLPLKSSVEVNFKNIPNLLETCSLSKHTTIGFFIHDNNKNRNYKIFTDAHVYVSFLKGSEKDIARKFITLKQQGLKIEYLKYFPEHTRAFELLERLFEWYINYFYNSYVKIKILKQLKPEDEYINHEKIIIQDIHSIYLETRVNTSKNTVELLLKLYPTEILRELLRDSRN